MLSTFIRFKDRELILELIKEDIAENCIPMEVVGLFDEEEEESGCADFVNVVDVKALFEEMPSRDRAECGVMSEIEDQVVIAADELARHGVTKMVLHIPDTFRLYREAFIKRTEYVDGWAATAAVYFSAFKNGRQVYPLFDADGRVSSVTYAE